MIDKTLLGLLLLVGAVIIVLFVRRRAEGFVSSGIPKYDTQNHTEYVNSSIKKYNPLAAQYDVTRPNFARTDDPIQLDKVTRDIKSAMMTAEIYPDSRTGSRFGVAPRDINISLPPSNEIIRMANKCEAIQGRGCDALKNPENASCGICIKGGTSFSQQDKPGKHIGGLLVLPDDRREAEARAGQGEPAYYPTVGECAPGYFYVSAEKCAKATNRLECEEAGAAGGFDGTLKHIARSKCAQVTNGDGNTFVYEPRGRKFRANLRVVTPSGTGDIAVYVISGDNTKLIGSYVGSDSGKEIVVPISQVGEGDVLNVYVLEKFPHRPRGRNEVFQVNQANKWYGENKESSDRLCQSMGARLASKADLGESFRKGAETCACGYTTSDNSYPMQSDTWIPGCGRTGIQQCPTTPNTWNKGGGNSWCYGVKPPNSKVNVTIPTIGNIPAILRSYIFPFYNGSKGVIWSEFGDEYQAPSYRGVIVQWESEDGARVVPFEPTIVKVNNMGPSSESSDGTKTFSNLRRLGTYGKSTMILSPRPAGGKILSNQFWMWSNQPNDIHTSFTVKVPGILMDPFYPEDKILAPRGPLISTPETMRLLRTSPCLRDGEEPGKYSIECLNTLFRSAGGDPLRGKLATEGGGLTQLLKLGDMDAISQYLDNLFVTATKGRDSMGNRVGNSGAERIAMINDAAQKMFGFDLTTPCEDVVEDAAGNMTVVAKSGPFNADCLDYVWMNTGNDRERGNEDTTRKTAIKNTYTTLMDRYSGLRSGEGSAEKRKQHPFQACQRSGSKAPIGVDGRPNAIAIAEANSKGSMANIQNWYNSIHQNANFMSSDETNNTTKKEFVNQCYGINRIDYVPIVKDCDAVEARYVRVLATGIASSTNPGAACIQIPQLQVFDAQNKEIARGKPTSSHSVGYGGPPERAVNGDARPKTHSEGEYHDDCSTPDRQFWMVDLGSTVKVSRVVYYPRTDCCTYRQIAAPVQLLDERKRIVAQQWIGQDNVPIHQIQTLTFTSELAKPIVPLSSIKPGLRFSLQSATSFDRYLRHGGFAFWVSPKSSDTLFKNDGTFILRPARNGNSSMVSFESVNYPNRFLRHAGFRCWLHSINSGLDKEDSSFMVVNALNGDPSMVSFRSSNFPQYYLSTKREAPTEIWITTVDTSNVWDVQRASWKFTGPLA